MARFSPSQSRVGDVLLLVLCVVAMHVEIAFSADAEPGAVGSVVIVVAALPVLLRRRAPVRAFVGSMALLVLVMETASVYNTMVLAPVLCGYTLADRRGLRAALAAGVLGVPVVLWMLHTWSPHPLLGWDTAKNVGLVALPLALGVAAHDRRAYTAALVERAEVAERNREDEALRRVGEERLRIARDVHDIVAHAMVTINVQAGVGAHLTRGDTESSKAHATLLDIKKVSGDALGELRSMLGILREGDAEGEAAPTHPMQRLADVGELRESLSSAGVDLSVEIEPTAALSIPTSVESAGYRIVQEALTNVIRHAGPTRATIRIARDEDNVLLEVLDEGGTSRRTPQTLGSGNGLRGMRERATALGGSLEAGPRAEGGWRVAASLPLSPAVTP